MGFSVVIYHDELSKAQKSTDFCLRLCYFFGVTLIQKMLHTFIRATACIIFHGCAQGILQFINKIAKMWNSN